MAPIHEFKIYIMWLCKLSEHVRGLRKLSRLFATLSKTYVTTTNNVDYVHISDGVIIDRLVQFENFRSPIVYFLKPKIDVFLKTKNYRLNFAFRY